MAITSPRQTETVTAALVEPSTGPPRSIGYSADCMNTIGWLGERLQRMLMRSALAIARSDGRTLVTGDDVFAALDQLGLSNVYPQEKAEEDDDVEGG